MEIIKQRKEKKSSFGTGLGNLLFKNLTNRQTFAKNAFWMAVGNIGGRFIRAAIIIYAARVLGAGAWGLFSYGITLVAFLTIFVDIGIDSILTRETVKAKGDVLRQAQLISTAFFIKLFLLVIGVFIVVLIAPSFATLPGVSRLLNLMAAILVFDTLRNFGFALIRSREKMEVEAGLYVITNIAIVAFGFAALYLRPTVMSFTLAYAVGTAVGLLATAYVLRKEASEAFSHFSKPLVKEILSSAWPFAVSGVLGLLMLNTDILIIGMFLSAKDVGFYSASVRIVQLLYIFGSIAASSSLPIFSRLFKEERGRIKIALRKILKFSFSFSLPLAFCGIIAGDAIISFVFGKEYSPAAPSFKILLLTLAFNFDTKQRDFCLQQTENSNRLWSAWRFLERYFRLNPYPKIRHKRFGVRDSFLINNRRRLSLVHSMENNRFRIESENRENIFGSRRLVSFYFYTSQRRHSCRRGNSSDRNCLFRRALSAQRTDFERNKIYNANPVGNCRKSVVRERAIIFTKKDVFYVFYDCASFDGKSRRKLNTFHRF